MIKKLLTILILIGSISCNQNKLEMELNNFSKVNNCERGICILKLSDITWFEWDRIEFTESEEGLKLNFLNKKK